MDLENCDRYGRTQECEASEGYGSGMSTAPLEISDAVARVDALAADGQLLDAIALAQQECARLDDQRLHKRLVQLRVDAAVKASSESRSRADWPPNLPDPFPGVSGIPEITPDRFNAEVMGGAILHHGSLIVRGMIDREEAGRLAADIDRTFEAYDAWESNPEDASRWFSPIPLAENSELAMMRGWNRHDCGGIMAADSPAFLIALNQLYDKTRVVPVIAEYLGERPVISVGKTVLRRVIPTNAGDFHQDGAFLGRDVRTVNVWIALSDCGVDAPGLEVVDRRLEGIVPTGTGDASYEWSVGRNVAREANEGHPFARPVFAPGDAIIFDQLMLHATSYDPAMSKTRWAIESWFFAPSAYSTEQTPMLL